MRLAPLALGCALMLAAPLAHADGLPRVSLGVTGGTLGVGPVVGLHNPGSLFGARADAEFLGFGHDFSTDGVAYRAHANLRSGGLTGDLYPFRTGFRLSLGVRINGNSADVNSTPTGSIRVGGRTYTGSDVGTLHGRATYNTVAPYFGLGYTHSLFGPVDIALDAGAMYEGSGNLRLGASGPIASNPLFASGLAYESSRVHHYLSYASFYPVVQLSLGYHF